MKSHLKMIPIKRQELQWLICHETNQPTNQPTNEANDMN